MKLPRGLSGDRVVRALERLGFHRNRQIGSHVQLARGECRVTVTNHPTLAPGTLKSIIKQAGISVDELLDAL